MDIGYLHLLFVPEFVVTVLAAIAAFATIVTLGLPYMATDQLAPRLHAVATQRAQLRQKHFEGMAMGPPTTPSCQSANHSSMRDISCTLKLEATLSSPATN